MNNKGEVTIPYLIAFVLLIALFSFSMINSSIYLSNNVGANNSVIYAPGINNSYGNIISNFSTAESTARSQKQVADNETIKIGTDSLISESSTGGVTKFKGTFFSFLNLIGDIIRKTFGLDPIIFSVISTICIVLLLVVGWRTLRTGQ